MSWDADNEPFDSKHQDDDPWVRSLDEAFVRKLAQARRERHESRKSRNLRALHSQGHNSSDSAIDEAWRER